ncbi:MAG: hypothetical protein RLN82_01670 [Pseudomonadales bacterium]
MKKFLIGVLILNAVFEFGTGAALLFFTDSIVPADQVEGTSWAIAYGFGAFAIASTVFWVWKQLDEFKTMGSVLGIMAVFHTGLTTATATAFAPQTGIPAAITHGFLALSFWFLLLNRQRWCVVTTTPQ